LSPARLPVSPLRRGRDCPTSFPNQVLIGSSIPARFWRWGRNGTMNPKGPPESPARHIAPSCLQARIVAGPGHPEGRRLRGVAPQVGFESKNPFILPPTPSHPIQGTQRDSGGRHGSLRTGVCSFARTEESSVSVARPEGPAQCGSARRPSQPSALPASQACLSGAAARSSSLTTPVPAPYVLPRLRQAKASHARP
jgi:hypothetical protein